MTPLQMVNLTTPEEMLKNRQLELIKKNDQKELSIFDRNALRLSVAKLWYAVHDGIYSARSIVGDEVLHMKEILWEDGTFPDRPE